MNKNDTLSTSATSSSNNLSPRSTESRNAMFKMLSETLRPPPSSQFRRRQLTKSTTASTKINKKSPRTPTKIKSSIASLTCSVSGMKAHDNSKSFVKSTTDRKNSNTLSSNRNKKIEKSFQPAPMKECHLSNVLRSAKHCLHELRDAKESLSDLVARDEQLSHGIKKENPTEDHLILSQVSLSITNLCQQAFVPAHRLNQTAIALYSAEDFLRYPSDIRTFDLHTSTGRIKLPDVTFNKATITKLRQVVDFAAETYNKFNAKGRVGEELAEILFYILKGYQDFYAAALGCQEIFKVLLYTGKEDKAHLQQFLLALSPIDRSDMLVEIQDLRRILDEIVIFLEKLSWGSFVVYRLAGGKFAHTVVPETPGGTKFKESSAIPSYPAYPLLKAKGPKLKQKNTVEDLFQPIGAKLDVKLSGTGKQDGDQKIGKSGNAKKSKFSKKKMITEEEVGLNGLHVHKQHLDASAPAGDSISIKSKSSSLMAMNNANNGNVGRFDANNNRWK